MSNLKYANGSNPQWLSVQRLGTIIAPLVAASLSLLAGLDLFSIVLVTVAVAFPASLYNRRLSASANILPSYVQQGTLNEIFENRKNIVVYKTAEGPHIIAFYKIIRQPQDYSLHTLKASFAKTNLTLYPIIHTNGPFLAIRFSSESKNDQNQFIWDLPSHLDAFTQTLMQRFAGLEIIAATPTDIKTLMTIFGTEKLSKKSTLPPEVINSCHFSSDREEEHSHGLQRSVENLRNLLRNSEDIPPKTERGEPQRKQDSSKSIKPIQEELQFGKEASAKPFEKPLQQEHTVSTDPANSRDEMKTVTILPKEKEEDLIPIMESFQKIIAAVGSGQDRPNAVPITPIGKRIAGHLVAKDLKSLLDILQNLENLPIDVQSKITAYSACLERLFGTSFDSNIITHPDELWARIPGAVELIESILEDLLSAYETHLHQKDRTLQSALF
ncbi:MAG: hypothetical protein ACFFB3_02610 [Candidatus Hodarchaeota archaeon]